MSVKSLLGTPSPPQGHPLLGLPYAQKVYRLLRYNLPDRALKKRPKADAATFFQNRTGAKFFI